MNDLINILLQPLEKWIKWPNLLEINVVEPKWLYLEIDEIGYIREHDGILDYQYWLRLCFALANMSGFYFDENLQPRISTMFPGGHRFEAMVGANVCNKLSISIRIKNSQQRTLEEFNLSKVEQKKLIKKINHGVNIIVSGGTSSGKTAFLNALAMHVPKSKRILTVEDANELNLQGFDNVVQYIVNRNEKARIGYNQIIDHIMRSRPDFIIVGEVSIYNAFPILRLLNSGHQGFFCTIHAHSADLALTASFRQNIQLAGINSNNISQWLTKTIDLVIHLKKKSKGIEVQEIIELKK